MSGSAHRHWMPLADIVWLKSRSLVYLMATVVAAQAFVGVAGMGKGGEWIIAGLLCEMLIGLWLAAERGWFDAWRGSASETVEAGGKIRIQARHIDLGVTKAVVLDILDPDDAVVKQLSASITGSGLCILRHGGGGEVFGVLLSRDEYELLNSAAAIASDRSRLEALLQGSAGPEMGAERIDQLFGALGA